MVSKLKQPYIHVVTIENLPGYTVKEVKGLVWGTTVRSKFLGTEILALLKVMVGGEIKDYTSMLNEARRYVIERMVDNARALGANAVIGVRTGTSTQTIPGAAEIFAYGTAVVVEPVKRGKQ
jgi:uncharacterized protein YbjQ (UPF0145 family)